MLLTVILYTQEGKKKSLALKKGWSDRAMALGTFQCRAAYYFDNSRARLYSACSWCGAREGWGWGGRGVWIFFLSPGISFILLPLSYSETAL